MASSTFCTLAALLLVGIARAAQPGDDLLYNQVQFLGTDQSAHVAPPAAVISLLNEPALQSAFADQGLNLPEDYLFSHLTISEMLNAGMRGFELDVLDDPTVGKYAYSAGLKLAGQDPLIHPDLLKPGLKVLSSPDFDFGSTCYLFTGCLQEMKDWSAANPGHFPVTVFIHHGGLAKAPALLGSAYNSTLATLQSMNGKPTNFTAGKTANLTTLEAEILSVFNRSQLYTPDDMRKENNASADAALRDIVLANGALNGSWPTIGRLRNTFVFMADPDYFNEIAKLHPNSTNSLLFFADDQGDTDPNVVVLDNYVDVRLANTSASKPYPLVSDADLIVTADAWGTQSVVLQGFFIRAGSDTGAVEAKYNYTLERDLMATIGGPQFIATLYETTAPALLGPSNYSANPATVPGFNGAEAICNPVTVAGGVTAGSTAFPFDGAIPNLGAANVLQTLPNCSVPNGYSAGKYTTQPLAAPGPTSLPTLAPSPSTAGA